MFSRLVLCNYTNAISWQFVQINKHRAMTIFNSRSLSQQIQDKRRTKLSAAQIEKLKNQGRRKAIKQVKKAPVFGTKREAGSECTDTLSTGANQDSGKNCALFSRYCTTEGAIGDRMREDCRATCGVC